jgi:hypothetical protein
MGAIAPAKNLYVTQLLYIMIKTHYTPAKDADTKLPRERT